MPLRGSQHTALVSDEAPYFETLSSLDDWADTQSTALDGVVQYRSRRHTGMFSRARGKLLVCHDYKGGYTESPTGLSYTFNFWCSCDIFVYFAHHRVTIPPSGWVTAAHRQGVKILGTLIFEGDGEEDCLRLLVGKPPGGTTGPPRFPPNASIPISPHYAILLARLARQRGFDGYLLNVECPLRGGVGQARALSAWIGLLERELRQHVGEHAQAIWYDSVIFTGQLRWQDRLNSLYLPFFLPSSALFTNYTWPPYYPSKTARYFKTLNPNHLKAPRKALNDIYAGVDVWGRGSHGGGGFGSYKAISHISPEYLGLSVALFGQAWTWETEQDKPGFTWESWWAYEHKLWLGPENADEVVEVPEPPEGQPNCPHGRFVPITSYFDRNPPPNPDDLPFFTSFSPGVGRAWFVKGKKVLETETGWTDVQKNCSIGDLVWPHPTLSWEHGERDDGLPRVTPSIDMVDAWLGGSSLRLDVSLPASTADDAYFRCVWLPIHSLSIASNGTYEAYLIYRSTPPDSVEFDIGLSVKSLGNTEQTFEIISLDTDSDLRGWTKLAIKFRVEPLSGPPISEMLCAVGLVVGFAAEDSTQAILCSISIGALSVYPWRSTQSKALPETHILWAHFEQTPSSTGNQTTESNALSGTLTWGPAISFPVIDKITIDSPEDQRPAWTSEIIPPSFLYFNVYMQKLPLDGGLPNADDAIFVGTTGLDGRANQFYLDPGCIPDEVKDGSHLRFLVQGVTDVGIVLPWERCAFVDVRVV
ncbi:hypothetical protein K474DRAFT_1706499 [Panus rudis PR-1116 ss-1]|nr:hypothetical protein K474DRAFT_1706499 [Panus rudis PR-1116 ss-1]